MNKSLKFRPFLVPLVLSGEKNVTWRLFDDKDLQVGDLVDLLNWETRQKFAIAEITKVIEKPLGKLCDEDYLGHEKFKDKEEMYKTYSIYYQKAVGQDTLVKIISFTLVNN